jgi:hypothetical protein
MTLPGCRIAAFVMILLGVLLPAAPINAAPHARDVFGAERFARGRGAPTVFTRTFRVPPYVTGPFTLTILNGEPDPTHPGKIEGASLGTVTLNGVEIVGPRDFAGNASRIDRTVVLAAANVLEITLVGAPDGFLTVSVAGVVNLGDLVHPRSGHAASVLADGSVLITGGDAPLAAAGTAERFDPLALTFSAAGDLETPRGQHSASVLADQSHLLAAGRDAGGTLSATEVFDATNGTFVSLPADPNIPRYGHTATMLLDGSVLIAGGRGSLSENSTERFDAQPAILFKPSYDPGSGSFTLLSQTLIQQRWDHSATLLADGRVLFLGGRNESGFLAAGEVFDPSTGEFDSIGSLPEARAGHTATLLPDGTVLILGGQNDAGYLDSGVVFNPSTGAFAAAPRGLIGARANHTATLLHYGEILVTGGESGAGPLASTEFYELDGNDVTPPAVQNVLPSNEATGVDLTQVIGVRFSEPLDVTTLHAGSVQLETNPVVDAVISPSEDGLLLFILPEQPLLAGSSYLLTLTSEITDTSGNPLAATTVEFTTVGAPTITGFLPQSGQIGTGVVISGQNFDPAQSLNLVKFGTIETEVLSASDTELDVSVPAGLVAGPVGVSVTTRGGTAYASFVVENPVPFILELSPETANAGSAGITLSVFGSGFVAGSQVMFGDALLFPSLQTPGQLDVEVPAELIASIGTVDVVVLNPAPGGGTSNPAAFGVRGVVISGVVPLSGAVGTVVVISGEGFDPITSNNQVSFNGIPSIVTSATDSVLETIVPALATSGPISVTTPIGMAVSAPFTVTAGARLLISKSPDQALYGQGEPITITAQLLDADGQIVPGVIPDLVSEPPADARVGNTFVYLTDGIYEITATAAADGGGPIVASLAIRVEGHGPTIACTQPIDGAILNATPGSTISFTGSVASLDGVTAFTVNGTPVAVDAAGTFTTPISAIWGMNFVDLEVVDGSGRPSNRTCSFLLSSSWAPEHMLLSNTVMFRAAQAAIDDGSRAGGASGVNSFADILAVVLNAQGLRDTLHAALLAADPLKPASCDQQVCVFGFCACVLSSEIRYIRSTLPGPNTTTLTLVNGGFMSRIRFEDPSIRLRAYGRAAGIPYDTEGNVNVDFVEVDVTFDARIDGAGRPDISIRSGSVQTRVGAVSTSFSGIDGFIINIINSLANGTVRNILANTLHNYVVNNFNSVMDGLIGSLDVNALGSTYEVPRLDGAAALPVGFGINFSSLSTNSSRLLSGIGTKFQTVPAHSRPTLGTPLQPGPVFVDPASAGQSVAIAVHTGVLGQALHALWRGGYFDAVLSEGALSGLIPAGATLRIATALPPAAALRSDGRLEVAVGGINVHLEYPALLPDSMGGSVGGRVSCDPRLQGNDVVLENCTVDELHLPTASVLSEDLAAALEDLLTGALGSIVTSAVNDALPALPIPGFRISASLGAYGLPAGGELGLVTPTLSTPVPHFLLRGGFGVR